MQLEKNSEPKIPQTTYTTLVYQQTEENLYMVRDAQDKKADITELFSQFTANIIRENTVFTR